MTSPSELRHLRDHIKKLDLELADLREGQQDWEAHHNNMKNKAILTMPAQDFGMMGSSIHSTRVVF